jgi:hypothetical protein
VTAIALVAFVASLAQASASARTRSQPWYVQPEQVDYGYIRSVTPLGAGYKLRFELYRRLDSSSKTDVQACIDSHACPPGTTGWPDDVRDEDLHYLLTLYLPPSAEIVLVGSNVQPVRASARQLYRLGRGENPAHLPLMARTAGFLDELGFYVEVVAGRPKQFDSAIRLAQVYHP